MSLPDTIVLISIDDLRYDAIGASELDPWLAKYDALDARTTPTLDRLAAEGAFYRDATSTSSYTPPSHASMFTGRYPHDHGAKTFFNTQSEEEPTVQEFLQDRGYRTAAWIENQALEMLGITRGFDEVTCPFTAESANLFEFIERATANHEKSFVFIHLFDVHKPYCYTPGGEERSAYNGSHLDRMDAILPEGCPVHELFESAVTEAEETVPNYESISGSLREYAHHWSLDYLIRERLREQVGEERFKYLIELYLSGVEKFDKGRFDDVLEALRDAIGTEYLFCVTSDHGEAVCRWKDRFDFMNSFNVSEQAVRVPLFLDSDVCTLPDEISRPVNHIDIFPTLADLADTPAPKERPGTSLLSKQERDEPIFHESWYYEGGAGFFGNVEDTGDGGLSEVAVRSPPYKLIYSFEHTGNPSAALYDLSEDPFETENILADGSDHEGLGGMLDAYIEDFDKECTPDEEITGEDDELRDHLQALGYLE